MFHLLAQPPELLQDIVASTYGQHRDTADAPEAEAVAAPSTGSSSNKNAPVRASDVHPLDPQCGKLSEDAWCFMFRTWTLDMMLALYSLMIYYCAIHELPGMRV